MIENLWKLASGLIPLQSAACSLCGSSRSIEAFRYLSRGRRPCPAPICPGSGGIAGVLSDSGSHHMFQGPGRGCPLCPR